MKLLNANLLWYTGLLILLVHLIPGPVFSQDRSKRKIIIGTFLPYKSQPDSSVKEKIEGELSRNFGLDGFEVRSVDSTAGTEEILSKLKSEEGSVFITGYYRKNAGVNLNLYCQIYNPETGFMIDALNVSDELEGLEGIRLPDEETKEDDSKIITKFVAKILTRIKLNSQKKERRENINEYVASSPISKDIKFNTRREDVKAEAEAVFKLLENQEVVTATRTKTKIKDAPAAVYVVTAQMIRERGYRTLEDALADLPGFDFQHSGLYPDLIHQRGLVGSMQRTLLYVDGIPDNNINENAMLGGSVRFPLANIERIEVVSGPASALYGANAFNGIINIITKDGETNPGNHIDATYGTYEKKYTNPGASASFSARGTSGGENPIQYSVGGYYYKTDGPNFGGIQGLDPPNNGATKANPNYNYHYDPVYYYGRKACGDSTCKPDSKSIGYFWSPGYNVSQEETYNVTAKFSRGGFRFETINWQYLQGEGIFGNGTQQIDTKERGFESGKYDSRNLARAYGIGSGILTNTVKDKNGKVVSTSYGDQGTKGSNWDFQNNTVLAGYIHKFSDTLSLDNELIVRSTQLLSSSHEQYQNTTGVDARYRPGDVTEENKYSRPDKAFQGEQRLAWNPTSNLSGIFGVSAKHFVVAKDYGSSERYTYTNYAIFAQQQYRPFEKLSLTAGFRRDYITTYGYASTPRLSAVYTPIKDLTFKFLVGTAFREPATKELFSQTAQRKPNPALRPEQLRSLEAGAGYRFLKNYYASVQGYYNSISNLIIEVQTTDNAPINGLSPTGGSPWNQNQNVGKAHIYGLELETNANVRNNLNLSLNYTFDKGQYYDLPSSLQSSPSTAGRSGENFGYDIYKAAYTSITGATSTVPTKGDIPNIAPHKANIGATYYLLKNLSFYLGVNYVDVRRTVATDPVRTSPGYKMYKFNIRWEDFWKPGTYVQVHVVNATNEQFFDPGIRNASGGYYATLLPIERRNIWFTVGYKF